MNMNYLGIKTKIALTMNEEEITDYIFDHVKETKNSIALWNDDTIEWYDKKTCKLTKQIKGVSKIVLNHDLFIFTYDKYKGANDLDGKTIILSDKYTEIIPNDYCIEVRTEDEKCGAFSYDGKCIMPVNCGSIIFLESGMTVTPPDDSFKYYGLYPYDGTGAIISNKHRYTHHYNKDVIIYQDPSADPDNCKSFIIFSHNGETRGRFKTDDYGRFYLFDNAIKIDNNGKKGLVSLDGKVIVPSEFDFITENGEKENLRYILDKGDKAGIATIEKGITVPVEFDEKIVFYDRHLVVKKDNKFALYSYDGEELIPLDHHTITETIFEVPGVFEVTNNFDKKDKLIYIAPLNKYIEPCHIRRDRKTGEYYYFDTSLGDYVKM